MLSAQEPPEVAGVAQQHRSKSVPQCCPRPMGFSSFIPLKVSLCNLSCHTVDQAGLKPMDLPASDFRVLGLKVCANTSMLKN